MADTATYSLFGEASPAQASPRARPQLDGPDWLKAHDASVPDEIFELRDRGAMFVINHSGGKDSQSMYAFLRRHIPDNQIKVVHAILPEVEWDGVIEHIETNIVHELITCQAGKTLLEMIERRGMFPSPAIRQCTSDLKRGPLEKAIRALVEDRIAAFIGVPRGAKTRTMYGRPKAIESGCGLVVNCMGMRAEESPKRSKLETLKFSQQNSKNGREWHEWLPIHAWTVDEVFGMIAEVGQKPHWAYEQGMSRLSCCFCIMSSKEDLTTAARLNPMLYRRYVELERSTGQVMLMPTKQHGRLTLEDVTGIYIDGDQGASTRKVIPIAVEKAVSQDEPQMNFC